MLRNFFILNPLTPFKGKYAQHSTPVLLLRYLSTNNKILDPGVLFDLDTQICILPQKIE